MRATKLRYAPNALGGANNDPVTWGLSRFGRRGMSEFDELPLGRAMGSGAREVH